MSVAWIEKQDNLLERNGFRREDVGFRYWKVSNISWNRTIGYNITPVLWVKRLPVQLHIYGIYRLHRDSWLHLVTLQLGFSEWMHTADIFHIYRAREMLWTQWGAVSSAVCLGRKNVNQQCLFDADIKTCCSSHSAFPISEFEINDHRGMKQLKGSLFSISIHVSLIIIFRFNEILICFCHSSSFWWLYSL